jgi:hypothetical protein
MVCALGNRHKSYEEKLNRVEGLGITPNLEKFGVFLLNDLQNLKKVSDPL